MNDNGVIDGQETLPAQWIPTTIGTIYKVIGGGTPSTSCDEYWGGDIPWITSADIKGVRRLNISRYVTDKGIQQSTTNKVPPRTLLVVTRVGLGKIAISDGPICFSQDLQGLVQDPNLILPEYALYYLSFALERLKFQGRGTTISGLTKKQLKDTVVPLAPSKEQIRIVAKIEELFSELDKGVENLKTAHQQLKVYRQAVLKDAFEGKLTEQWREDNKDKLECPDILLARIKQERESHYQQQLSDWNTAMKMWEANGHKSKKPGKPHVPKPVTRLHADILESLPTVPACWVWIKLGWMTCGVEYGTAAKSSESGAVPVIRMGNIQNAMIDWSDLVYTSDSDEIEKYMLAAGDVLFNRTNSPELVGKTAIYRGERPAVFAGYLIRLNQISSIVDSQYLNLFLNSLIARQYGNSVKTDGVNQSNINGEKLQGYPFPYCSLAEQQEVVRIVDEKLSLADRMISDINAELLKATALRQAILKKAFSGQLVSQDPNDEPASVLLERIKAEKARATAAPTKSRNGQEPINKKRTTVA